MLVLLVMFAVGALTGAATMRVAGGADATPRARAESRESRPDLFERLELTPEQRVQVDAIMERRRDEMDAFWKQHGPQLRAITDSARVEIRSVLTEEQRAAEEEFRAERRRHYESRH
jgi:Spy/CpxP family protein refolding chaperone